MKRGSEWRKWDLHVHTKGTNKNDQFTSLTMEDFFLTFFRKAIENSISAVGVTDYFSIERYIKTIEYREEIESKVEPDGSKLFTDDEVTFIKKMFIFPNVELRMLPATDKGRLINIHCLFNPDYVSYLENDFFSHISNQDGEKMNRDGLTLYGKSLDHTITNLDKQYEKGVEHFVIDLKTLKDLISANKRFRDNTLLVVSNSSNDGASAIQQHYDMFENESGSLDGFRKSIYKVSDAIFSSNSKDVKYFIGKKSEGKEGYDDNTYRKEVEEVLSNRGSLKACISGCDAHTEIDMFKKFTWIKADLNFEGLRQICFEPEQRVKIQNNKPDYKEDKLVLDKVKFISPNKIFSSIPIYLNPNLNVIIGGKSSGKSILIYSIAKTLLTDQEILKNDDGNFRYDLSKIEQNFDFEITTKGGFSQKLNRKTDENSILPEIKFIPQNYLVKLAEPEINKTGRPLNKLVRDLIIEDVLYNEYYQSFLSKVKQNDKLRNTKIDDYFETLKNVNDLEREIKTKSSVTVLEKNIEANVKKVEELNKSIGLSQEQIDQYKIIQEKLEKNKYNIQMLKDDLALTQEFTSDFVHTISDLNQRKESFLNALQLQDFKEFYQLNFSIIDDFLQKAILIENSIKVAVNEEGKRYFENSCKFSEVAKVYTSEHGELTKQIEPFLKNEQVKKAIEELNKSIAADKKSLLDIDTLAKRIKEKKKLLIDIKDELFRIYENSFQEYISVISLLKDRTIELEKDGLTILGKVKFNFPKFRKELLAISDGRTASYINFNILSDKIKATEEVDFKKIITEVKLIFEDMLSGTYALTNRTTIINAIKLVLEDYFFDYWEITYKNDKLGAMSTGKASFVILMLIIGLSKSKAPILIDQPEDNLDNRSITTDLVNYLRSKKLDRQIIIVTHNANIVVNADAENVIVANQKGQSEELSTSHYHFDYINGSIEDSFEKQANETDILKSMGIRQHIADIVEGGKDAFIMREKKYRFK